MQGKIGGGRDDLRRFLSRWKDVSGLFFSDHGLENPGEGLHRACCQGICSKYLFPPFQFYNMIIIAWKYTCDGGSPSPQALLFRFSGRTVFGSCRHITPLYSP